MDLGDTQSQTWTAVLFEQYLERREAGDPAAARDVLARAGEFRGELEERIALHESLEGLGADDRMTGGTTEVEGLESFGRFQRLSLIGRGGLSRVYLAHDPELRRDVAVKVLGQAVLDGSEGRAWLKNEARALAGLAHRGIVAVFDVGEHAGCAYVAMERVVGPSLAAVLRALRARHAQAPESSGGSEHTEAAELDEAALELAARLEPLEARCRLVRDVAEALAYCHARGVIHRDVKPANVLVELDGRPRLIDFGLASVLGAGHATTHITQGFVGTPAYVSPEQVANRQTGASALSDQFALAVVFYELLTGTHPFDKGGREETLDAIARAEPPRPRTLEPRISADLELCLLHALEKVPQERYSSLGELARDITAVLEHRPISVARPSPWHAARRFLRRHRAQVRVAVSVGGLALALGVALAAKSTLSARSVLRDQIDELGERLAHLATPYEFSRAWVELRALRDAALDFDRGLSARLGGSLLPAVEAQLSAGVGALEERIDLEQRAASERDIRYDLGVWSAPLWAAEELFPGGSCRYFGLGQTWLAEGLEPTQVSLWRQEARRNPPDLVLWEEVPFSPILAPGFYRLQSLAPDGSSVALELDFDSNLAQMRRELAPLELSDWARARMDEVAISRGDLLAWIDRRVPNHLGREVRADLAHYVPARKFLIAREPVSWEDVTAEFGAELVAPWRFRFSSNWERRTDPRPASDSEGCAGAAVIPFDYAREFARRHGARLPTDWELALASELNAAFVPADEVGCVRGEYSSLRPLDMESVRDLGYGRYLAAEGEVRDLRKLNPVTDHFEVPREMNDDMLMGFRLARTLVPESLE